MACHPATRRRLAVLGPLVALLLVVCGIQARADGIVVHAPQGGTYEHGRSCKVRWTARGIEGPVQIQLIGSGQTRHRRYIRTVPASAGEFVFAIPDSVPQGRYYVRVMQAGGASGRSRVILVAEAGSSSGPTQGADPRSSRPDYRLDTLQISGTDNRPLSMVRGAMYELAYGGTTAATVLVRSTVLWNGIEMPGGRVCRVFVETSYKHPSTGVEGGRQRSEIERFGAQQRAQVLQRLTIPPGLNPGTRVRVTVKLAFLPACDGEVLNNRRNFVLLLEGGPPEGVDLRCDLYRVRYRQNLLSHSRAHKVTFVVGGYADGATQPIYNVAFQYRLLKRYLDVEDSRWLEVDGIGTRGMAKFDRIDPGRETGTGPHEMFISRLSMRYAREHDCVWKLVVAIDPNENVRDRDRRNNFCSHQFRIR